MSTATVEGEVIRKAESGDWPAKAITVAQILAGIVAITGIAAWATLVPVFILTFLFLEPLLIVAIILFVVAALFSEKTLLTESFSAGTAVIHEGTHADYIYSVKAGKLRGEGYDGKEHFTRELGPGDCFGLHAAVANQTYSLTVTAVTDAVVYRINPADLSSVLSSFPQVQEGMKELLNTRFGDLVGRG